MRTEFIYSLAALSAIPVAANADAEAYKADKALSVTTGADVELAVGKLATGKYTLSSAAISGADLTVKVMDGDTEIKKTTVKNGKGIDLTFELASTIENVKVVLVKGSKDITVPAPVITLNYDFKGVASKLMIEHNKLSQALKAYGYDTAADITYASALYDRIQAINGADYDFYVKNTESLQTISLAADQLAGVAELPLYTDIQNLRKKAKASQETYIGPDGEGILATLDARYTKLGTMYTTDDLSALKVAAASAYTEYAAGQDDTLDALNALKAAIEAYKAGLDAQEAIQKDNEEAKADLDKELANVAETYYNQTVEVVNKNFTDEAGRYNELLVELNAELAAIVDKNGNDYKEVAAAINASYEALTAKADKNDLINKIAQYKEKINAVVAEYNGYKATVASAYEKYDAEKKAADALTKGAADFMVAYKNDVDNAVANLLTYIQSHDTKATVVTIQDSEIEEYIALITKAKEVYSTNAAIYKDYTALKAEVTGLTTSLSNTDKAIDNYAKTTKKLDEKVFKPTTIWASTIGAINADINTLSDNVDANKTDASEFKASEDYTKAKAAITAAINELAPNANAATDIYATIQGQIKAEQTLQEAISNVKVAPKIDFTALNVWTNQVTTDETIKARTPYKTVTAKAAATTEEWIQNLATAITKTDKYDADADDNSGNILGFLNKIAPTPADVLKAEIETLKAITENYEADEKAFEAQMEAQEIDALKTLTANKIASIEPRIETLEKNIEENLYGQKNLPDLQKDIDAIKATIAAANAVLENKDATKAQVNEQYEAISEALSKAIVDAEAKAQKYADAFAAFKKNYDDLNGTEEDNSDAQTVNGLLKKVAEQKAVIAALENLTDTQKETFEAQVEDVSYKENKVEYTVGNIKTFMENAMNEEVLKDDEVTKYQTIIGKLKDATVDPVTYATNMDNLEGQLATLATDMATAKANVLKADPNTNAYFYKLLTGTKSGQYQKQYNDLKKNIEKLTKVTADDVAKQGKKISDLNSLVNTVATQAAGNLDWYNAQKEFLAATKSHAKTDKEAFYGLDEAIEELSKEDYASSVQQEQLNTLNGYYDKITAQETATDNVYLEGKDADYSNAKGGVKVAADNTQLRNDIQDYLAQCTNAVNYNAQVAADNKAIYDAITAAHNDANAAYKAASDYINAYNNLKSTELKAAADKAQAELDALMTILYDFEKDANEIQGRADAEFGSTVSPTHFDTEETFKKEFEKLTAKVNESAEAFVNVIKANSIELVKASIADYTNAIAAAKTKVADFKIKDEDTPVTDLEKYWSFQNAENWLKAITDNFNEENLSDNLSALDNALVNAGTERTWDGETWKMLNWSAAYAEYQIARIALGHFIAGNASDDYFGYYENNGLTTRNFFRNNLIDDDLDAYNKLYSIINYPAYNSDTKQYRYLVENFASLKEQMQALQQIAEKNYTDKALVAGATDAINQANDALATAEQKIFGYVAGADLKPTLDQIKADLANYPVDGVTVANAEEWQKAAENIMGRILALYEAGFDAEVEAINGLIKTAKDEQVTYASDPNHTDAADKKQAITAQEEALADLLKKVALDEEDENYISKAKGLTTLKTIEDALNDIIRDLQYGNGTNKNQAIYNDLVSQYNSAFTDVNSALDDYTEETVGGSENWTTLQNEQGNINAALKDFSNYIYNNFANMAAYQANAQAKMDDITKAIAALKQKAAQMNADYEAGVAQQALEALADTWTGIQDNIDAVKEAVEKMNVELKAYDSASKYANKVSQLNKQIENAETILSDAQAAAEKVEKTADKQKIADQAQTDVTEALKNAINNSIDITGLAKANYIEVAIKAMTDELAAITWNDANYTETDKGALNSKKAEIQTIIDNAENEATYNQDYADPYKVGKKSFNGVKKTLADAKKTFDEAVAELKQMIKDYSLEQTVKGHITGGETIGTEDIQALSNIIANAQEGTADIDRCDVNGDGRVTVTDIIWLQYFWAFNEWPDGTTNARYYGEAGGSDNVSMEVVSTNGNVTRIAVNLNNETAAYRAFQIGLQLPAGAKVTGQSFGSRVSNGYLMHSENNEGFVRFMTISNLNTPFEGQQGAVLYVDIENLQGGSVQMTEAYFTDTQFNDVDLQNGSETTGITQRIMNAVENAGQKVYNLGGRMMDGLKKGINIVVGNDGTTKKVIK